MYIGKIKVLLLSVLYWKQRKSDEIFYSVSEKNHPRLPILSASQEKGMIYRDEIGIDIKYDKKSIGTYKRVIPGQFVIHLRSFQGGFAYSNVEGITSPAYTVLDFVNIEKQYPLFWRNVLTNNSFIKRLETVTYGIRDGRSISFSDFSTLKFNVPFYQEQRAIGDFFVRLDDTIALNQQKLLKLMEMKRAYLDQIFNQKIRFVGFSQEWEWRKSDEIFYSISEKNRPDLPILSASQEKGMIYRDELGINIKYDKQSTNTYKHVLPGQFVIHLRSFQGGFAYSNIEGITSPAYTILDFVNKGNHCPSFWRNVLTSNSFIKRLETVTYGIRDGRSISFSDFSTLKFNVPSYQEQQAIGVFFGQLDNTISLQQVKIDKLKKVKQGFSQKMFI